MRYLLTLLRADLKRIFRDRMMWVFLSLPAILIPILRWGVPFIGEYWPVIRAYDALTVGIMGLVSASSPALLVALLMLDEKDHGLFDPLRVMPISLNAFLGYRIGFIGIFGGLVGSLTLCASGLYAYRMSEILMISSMLGLLGPLIPLLIVSYASNKIEGVTLLKAFNMCMGFPVIVILLAPKWELISGIIPFYWVYKGLMVIHIGGGIGWIGLIGILIAIGLLILAYRIFERRVFSVK